MTPEEIRPMTKEQVVAGLRGVFNDIKDENLYGGVGIPILCMQGLKEATRQINNLDPGGIALLHFLRDPDNRHRHEVEMVRDLACVFLCQFLDLYEATVQKAAHGSPTPTT